MDDFFLRALIAGCIIAVITGVLGCFVVWRRMAYFGDSLAHSALLGMALSLWLGIAPLFGVIVVCFGFAALLIWIQQKHPLATDTALGILAHAALAFGIIALSTSNNSNFNLHGFLFGDILTVTVTDLWWLFGGGVLVLTLLRHYWQRLLLMVINPDLAAAEGASVLRLDSVLILLMTLTVAVSIHIIGVLLIAALLIIPAASARLLAKSPESMALLSAAFGVAAAVFGLWLSLTFDLPSGPAIVSIAALLFAFSMLLSVRRQ